MSIERINPAGLSKPSNYAHVTIVGPGRQAHVSGQVARDAGGAIVGQGDLAAQAEQVFVNLRIALQAAGADFSRVFKMVTYVVDLTPEKAALVRTVRNRHFGPGPVPAATMVGVTSLVDPGLLIEVEVIADLGD